MITFNFYLKDKYGKELNNNDFIRVTLPEWEINDNSSEPWKANYIYKPKRIIQGHIKLLLSKGLRLKITNIILDPEKDFVVGKEIIFKFKKWEWEIIEGYMTETSLRSDV